MEKIIGTMLGLIYVPPPGGSFVKFSLGGGDEQVVQPPLSADLPCTNDSVAVLFNLLGMLYGFESRGVNFARLCEEE